MSAMTGPKDTLFDRSKMIAMVPPPGTMLPGTYGKDVDDFLGEGIKHVRLFVESCAVQPGARVLDIGCGCGRMAVPLTQVLGRTGHYEGFDVRHDGIEWCRNNITPGYPNFRFRVVDVYNRHYRPDALQEAARFRFPFPDASFDAVLLISVFTHLVFDDVAGYLREIDRVTCAGGAVFASFFLLNDATENLIRAGRNSSYLDFRHDFGTFRALDRDAPERGVAYQEDRIRQLYANTGLQIIEPFQYGTWRDWENRKGENDASIQDIVVSVKRE